MNKFLSFEVLKVKDLKKDMILSFHLDNGIFLGTIVDAHPSRHNDKFTIMVKDILKDPEETLYFSHDAKMQFDMDPNKLVKIKVPSSTLLKYL